MEAVHSRPLRPAWRPSNFGRLFISPLDPRGCPADLMGSKLTVIGVLLDYISSGPGSPPYRSAKDRTAHVFADGI